MFLKLTEVCRRFWRCLMYAVGAGGKRCAVGPGVDLVVT